MRYLTIRIHYPSEGHRDDILGVVRRVAEAARKHEGAVDIGAWLDADNDRIIVMSLWESQENAAATAAELHPLVAGVPWEEWERQPSENLLNLVRAV